MQEALAFKSSRGEGICFNALKSEGKEDGSKATNGWGSYRFSNKPHRERQFHSFSHPALFPGLHPLPFFFSQSSHGFIPYTC